MNIQKRVHQNTRHLTLLLHKKVDLYIYAYTTDITYSFK